VAREQVGSKDLERLRPGKWLNDEVINFYGALVQRRADEALQVVGGKATNKKLRDIHFFNSFFYAKLQQGYEKSRLARWTKKVTGDCTTPYFSVGLTLLPRNRRSTSSKRTSSSSQLMLETSTGFAGQSTSKINV
jgi:sentrin-specific protease 1